MSFEEICLLNDSFPPIIDGVSNAVVNYAQEIIKSGKHACVVTPDCPDADDQQWEFPVIRYPSLDLRDNIGYVAGNPFSITTRLELNHRPISLLHSHCPIASNTLARVVRSSMHIPFIMTYHTKYDIDISNALKSKLLRAETIHALVGSVSACDELWVVSRGAGENIRALGYEGDYIVMENGVDLPRGRTPQSKVQKVTDGYDLPDGVPVFLFVGRLMWYKGLRITLDALSALKSQNLDFRMIIIGGGTDEEEIRAYTLEHQLSDRVFFLGKIKEREILSAWYCRADLFLFPSTFDTNGLVVREAAASSLASVLVKGSCAAEGVTDGEDALLIEENAASMAVCLTKVMCRPEVMKSIGQHAADNLYLSWHDAVGKAMDRYEIVLDNYKCGVYQKHHSLPDGIFRLSGELLGVLSEADAYRKDFVDKLERYL